MAACFAFFAHDRAQRDGSSGSLTIDLLSGANMTLILLALGLFSGPVTWPAGTEPPAKSKRRVSPAAKGGAAVGLGLWIVLAILALTNVTTFVTIVFFGWLLPIAFSIYAEGASMAGEAVLALLADFARRGYPEAAAEKA